MSNSSDRDLQAMSGENPFPRAESKWSGENPFPWAASRKASGLAQVKSARAFHLDGQLIIVAKGDKPNPCYAVTIERSFLTIHPPQYLVRACIDTGQICMQVVTPYRTANLFASGPVKEITLKTAGGDVRVEVQEIGADKHRITAAGGDHVPFPYAQQLNLSKLIEGELELLPGAPEPREATGYSDAFSFDEAFRDALANLPPSQRQYPDQLVTVTVSNVGALFGGIAGFNKMFVRVRAV